MIPPGVLSESDMFCEQLVRAFLSRLIDRDHHFYYTLTVGAVCGLLDSNETLIRAPTKEKRVRAHIQTVSRAPRSRRRKLSIAPMVTDNLPERMWRLILCTPTAPEPVGHSPTHGHFSVLRLCQQTVLTLNTLSTSTQLCKRQQQSHETCKTPQIAAASGEARNHHTQSFTLHSESLTICQQSRI